MPTHSTVCRLVAEATSRSPFPRATCRLCSSTSDAWARYRRASAFLLCRRARALAQAGSRACTGSGAGGRSRTFRSEPFRRSCSPGAFLRARWLLPRCRRPSPSSGKICTHLRLLVSALT